MTEGKPPDGRSCGCRGLRQRWIVNTVMPVLVLLILLMTLFSAGYPATITAACKMAWKKQAQALASAFDSTLWTTALPSIPGKRSRPPIPTRTRTASSCSLSAAPGASGVHLRPDGRHRSGTSDIDQAIAENEMKAFQGKDPETGRRSSLSPIP